MSTQGERIAVLEAAVKDIKEKQTEILDKLDDLITLKNKGAGAFWLAAGIVGTGIVTLVQSFFDWFKGIHL